MPVTTGSPTRLPEDVEAALSLRGTPPGSEEIVLLPSETRNGVTYYVEDDLDALNLAKADGLSATLLANSRFIHENAAGWELQMALATGPILASSAITALIGHVWHRVRHAKEQGLYDGDNAAAPVKLILAEVTQEAQTGDMTTRAIAIEGTAQDVTATLHTILGARSSGQGAGTTPS